MRGGFEGYWKSVKRIGKEVDLMKTVFRGTRTGHWFMHKAWPERRHRIMAEKVNQGDY